MYPDSEIRSDKLQPMGGPHSDQINENKHHKNRTGERFRYCVHLWGKRGKKERHKKINQQFTRDPFKHAAFTGHILVTRQQWGVPVWQMKDTSVLSFSCGKLTEWLFLYQEQLLTILSSPVFQDQVHLGRDNKISSNLHCHLWMKWQYECSFLSSEHPHQCRCILIRFGAMKLREEPDPSLKMATTIGYKEGV